jgi:hypothetical protein
MYGNEQAVLNFTQSTPESEPDRSHRGPMSKENDGGGRRVC